MAYWSAACEGVDCYKINMTAFRNVGGFFN